MTIALTEGALVTWPGYPVDVDSLKHMEREGAVLEARDLTVMYGSARGIVGIDIEVPAAGVTGLLGPNGSGKTTLLRAALDLVHPTSGEVRILGHPSRSPKARAEVAYLPGDLLLPGQLTGWGVLRRYTVARGELDRSRVTDLADRLDLDLNRRVDQLSKGNRQKIGLMLAFAPRARLLLLDEPTSGLDPLLQREFSALVRESVGAGVAVVLSSHVLFEQENLADRVAVLRSGELVAVETTHELRSRAQGRLRIELASDEEARSLAADLAPISSVTTDGCWVIVSHIGDVDPVIKAAARYTTRSVHSLGGHLDEVLLDFYSPGSAE